MIIDLFGLKLSVTMPYENLWLLIVLTIIIIATYILMVKIRKKRVLKLGNFHTLRRVQGYKVTIPHPYLLLAKIIIVTLLFLVATDSIQVNIIKPVTNTDFVLAIDASQTMLMPDYQPDRLGEAKKASIEWLQKLPAVSKIGVIQFSDIASPVVYPTTNFNKVIQGIRKIQVNLNASGTAIGDAIVLADSMLANSHKRKALIIITDGRNNAGINITSAVKKAIMDGLTIYAIGVGNNEKTSKFYSQFQELIRKAGYNESIGTLEMPDLDMQTLNEIASNTGGKAFKVTNEQEFENAFRSIVTKNEAISLNSVYYILLFIVALEIIEMLIFAKFGAL